MRKLLSLLGRRSLDYPIQWDYCGDLFVFSPPRNTPVTLEPINQQLADGPSDAVDTHPPLRSSTNSPAANHLCKVHTKLPSSTTPKPPNAIHAISAPAAPTTSSGTPVRKISASSFLSSITSFYTGAVVPPPSAANGTAADGEQQQQEACAVEGCNNSGGGEESFPEIKGRVESKLMSMWHNVKYGKFGFNCI